MHRTAPMATLLALLALAPGCGKNLARPPLPALLPVSGTVRVDDEPLPSAVVTFYPDAEDGTMCVGETDAEGRFSLAYLGYDGAAPGTYRVTVSSRMATNAKALGLKDRTASFDPAERAVADSERLPARYSDPSRTALRAAVAPGKRVFTFALRGPLADPPSAETPRPQGLPRDEQGTTTIEPVEGPSGPASATPTLPDPAPIPNPLADPTGPG